jgi:3'-phosphoadenosine 5'-phosphosulfate sulfotransferase (PAPS reductase)/FAD synthetase
MKIQDWELRQRQSLPLEAKILFSQRKIKEWVEHWGEDNCSVSFSGGKDSTVLLHLVRTMFPSLKGCFANTGLEYPEIVEFVRATPNIVELRPDMDFLSVVKKHGYPVVSKLLAHNLEQVRRLPKDGDTFKVRMTGVKSDGTISKISMLPKKWLFLIDAPFAISHKCCDALKKQPLKLMPNPIIGTMAEDSRTRRQGYLKTGCNSFDGGTPISRPLSIWLEDDIWTYLKQFNVPYSSIYDMGVGRTGCMFCLFGLHMEKRPDRFDAMQISHPKLFDYCMDGPLKLREVIRFTYGREYPREDK